MFIQLKESEILESVNFDVKKRDRRHTIYDRYVKYTRATLKTYNQPISQKQQIAIAHLIFTCPFYYKRKRIYAFPLSPIDTE